MAAIEKIVVVTKKTGLDELVERYNSVSQAKFYLEHMGVDFTEYLAAHDAYYKALNQLRKNLPKSIRSQEIDRRFLPSFLFGQNDLVVTLGPDGLVVNAAKYLADQPLLALNPDTSRIDGVLARYLVQQAATVIDSYLKGQLATANISMAKAVLGDGQSIYAVNDLFVGQQTHVSARYSLRVGKSSEPQSSSGIIISTGAGSTGWLRSVLTGAAAIVHSADDKAKTSDVENGYEFPWDSPYLKYSVREPFISKTSSAKHVFGRIDKRAPLVIESNMPQGGVIFSDGIEQDRIDFNSGAIAKISVAERVLRLISSSPSKRQTNRSGKKL